jgi:hypothetical protein
MHPLDSQERIFRDRVTLKDIGADNFESVPGEVVHKKLFFAPIC